MNRLQNKIAIITGESKGMGLATAEQFVADGAHVYITGRRQPELDAAVTHIKRNVTAIQGDASDLVHLDRLYEQVADEKRRVDIVFANAALEIRWHPLARSPKSRLTRHFNFNIRGLIFTVQKALPLMRQGGDHFECFKCFHQGNWISKRVCSE
jgi:NAD(P)-dependent dehydrogenase (short-subunit alcohol dehydrogenase family)